MRLGFRTVLGGTGHSQCRHRDRLYAAAGNKVNQGNAILKLGPKQAASQRRELMA